MVVDDDPQWLRFWGIYPLKVSKKEARTAWAVLSPDVALVDRMVEALGWQARLWYTQGYGTPYPASWLRGERWTDERPTAPALVKRKRWECPHVEHCSHPAMCEVKNLNPGKYPVRADAEISARQAKAATS